MKVKECKKCPHCERRVWSSYYEPKNYHPIGMSHAYAYCKKHKKRVLHVRSCDERKECHA